LTVSHLTVTLRIISDSHRSAPVINYHLLIDQAGGRYASDSKKFQIIAVIWQQMMLLSTSSSKEKPIDNSIVHV
jgi:hypothetical protein